MPADADDRAPGGAITVALCGHREHDPPCPLAPHHTAVTRDGSTVRLRVLYATEPHRVGEVRRRIDAALAAGDWQVVTAGCSRIESQERDHARRLVKSR
jgi:hypothetical protein